MRNDDLTDVETLVESGRFHDALALVDAAIEKSPEQARLWADKGWILFKMGDYTAATESFTEALERHPRAATTLFFRAQCKEKTGNLQGALDDYRASIAIKPRADALLNIGLILKYTGDRIAARVAFCDALELEPTSELALALLREHDSPPSTQHG